MSAYVIQKETLDNIAKQSNILAGKTDKVKPATIIDDLAAANAEISTQNELLNEWLLSLYEEKPSAVFAAILDGSITTISLDTVTNIDDYTFYNYERLASVDFPVATSIGNQAFSRCSRLISVNFPVATSIGNSAFSRCSQLISVNFPQVTSIDGYAFYYCDALTSIVFPQVTSISSNAFEYCDQLTSVDFPLVTSINTYVFNNCSALTTLILRNTERVCSLSSTNALFSTSINRGTGYIYVPKSLIEDYKIATNWSAFSSKFRAIEDYPEICGG